MGSNKSKIPVAEPGVPLPGCGIAEIDEVFDQARPYINELQEWRYTLDYKTTNFIRSLHAQRIWEVNGDIEEIMYMLLTVFSFATAGDIGTINLQFLYKYPFLDIPEEQVPPQARDALESFLDFARFITESRPALHKVKSKLKEVDPISIISLVSDLTFANDYSIEDQLQALEIVEANAKILEQAPGLARKLLRVARNSEETIMKALNNASVPPTRDVIVARGLQASAQRFGSVKKVMREFWPIQSSETH